MKNVFIISGPSGSGQDSIIESLALLLPLKRVITTTTRPKRDTESEGNPYHFIFFWSVPKRIMANGTA